VLLTVNSLRISEIFYSIQGESSRAGNPCVFLRLAGCNLRCSYCDTAYAFTGGDTLTQKEIITRIYAFKCKLVEITGGEPLLQQSVYPLMNALCDQGFEVLLETGGHMDISKVDQRVAIIMDIKCPSSGESDKVYWPNIKRLKNKDELKFVIGDIEDFSWAKRQIEMHTANHKYEILMAPVFGQLAYAQLAEWILKAHLPVRFQIQLHKHIWPPGARGV
jgi:7-carboxy-7-deazaguanine synthase